MALRIYCIWCFCEIRAAGDLCPTCGVELNPPGQEDATGLDWSEVEVSLPQRVIDSFF